MWAIARTVPNESGKGNTLKSSVLLPERLIRKSSGLAPSAPAQYGCLQSTIHPQYWVPKTRFSVDFVWFQEKMANRPPNKDNYTFWANKMQEELPENPFL